LDGGTSYLLAGPGNIVLHHVFVVRCAAGWGGVVVAFEDMPAGVDIEDVAVEGMIVGVGVGNVAVVVGLVLFLARVLLVGVVGVTLRFLFDLGILGENRLLSRCYQWLNFASYLWLCQDLYSSSPFGVSVICFWFLIQNVLGIEIELEIPALKLGLLLMDSIGIPTVIGKRR
jgi:hypothetical protein